MGIFEKSIPKYVINPIEQNVQVAPQPYVVDDIFDPILNANVRNALRQKYGSGLAGVGGGYAELLENAWGGDTGIFGKGMGVLSTFGRSMEKADDIVLGALTEGIEGVTGQGFDNPLKQIFVNDVDYTGKRFLASTANIGRNIVGTTVDEGDFGTAWNLPALGIELGTDVGILGGGLARKFAPAAKDFTSKQLFERLGKSDLKTTVGEVGQLMSNYDDLMAKVAIDVTAPGLRPAFKALGNKLAQLLQTQSPEEYFDIEIIKRNPKARKIIKEWLDEHPTAQMIDNVSKQMDELPEEAAEQVVKNPYEIALEADDEDALNLYNFIKNAVETEDYSGVDQAIRDYSEQLGTKITESYNTYGKRFAASLNGLIERLQAEGIPLDFVGISQVPDELPIQSLDEVRQIVKGVLGDDWVKRDVGMPELDADELDFVKRLIAINDDEGLTRTYIDGLRSEGLTSKELLALMSPEAWDDVHKKRSLNLIKENPELASRAYAKLKHRGIDVWEAEGASAVSKKAQSLSGTSLTVVEREAVAELENLKAHLTRFVKENPSASPSDVQKIYKRLYDKVRKKYPESVWASITSKDTRLTRFENLRPKRSIDAVAGANPTYVDEVLEKLASDDALKYALQNKEWTTNEAVNNAIEAALGDPKYSQSLWYAYANPKFRLSPSRMTKMDMFGQWGTSLAYTRLEAARFLLRDPNKPRFKSKDELLKYLSTPKMEEAIRDYFPKYASKDLDDIRKAIADVYYPKGNLTVREYTTSLDVLSRLLDDSRMINPDYKLLSSAPDESLFLEDLYRAFDEIEEYPDAYGRKAKYFGIDQLYLQPLRDEAPSSKGARRTAEIPMYSHRETIWDDATGTASKARPTLITGGDKVKGLRDDETLGLTSYAKSILSQVSKYIKTDEDMLRILGDFLDYVQIQPAFTVGKLDDARRYLSDVTGIAKDKITRDMLEAHVFKDRLIASKNTHDIVTTFRNEVLGSARAYLVKYGSLYKYPPKDAPEAHKKLFNELRARLGYSVNDYYLKKYNITPDPNGYANRLMLESLIQTVDGKRKIKKIGELTADDFLRFEDAAMKARISKRLPDPKLDLKSGLNDIFDRVRQEKLTTESADEAVEAVKHTIADAAPETVAKEAYETVSVAEAAVDKVIDELVAPIHKFLNDGGDPDAARKIFGEKKWSLHEQIQKASNVPTKNAIRAQRASLRTKVTEALGKAFTAITGKARPEDFQKYYRLRTAMSGDVVKGSDFWTTFRRTGILVAPYVKGSEMIDATSAALTKNAKLLNETLGKDVAEVVTYTLDNDNVAVVMRWTGDKNTALLVKNAQNSLNSAKFDDIVFTKARELTTEERAFMESATMKELTGLMEQLQAQAADQAAYLGFKFDDSTPYTKHAMRHDHHTAMWMTTNVYNRGVSSDDYDAIASAISGLDGYRQMDRGTFGTTLQDRRFRGDYWLLDNKQHPLFEYTPDKVFTSTLADGIFSNLQYQSFVDLFINETYKIKGWFKTVDDLKKVLYAKLDNGKMSGNLQNLELVSYKTDANGKITGLIKYDKMSDEGLAKALKDKNTILVPANSVSHMDNILRKDIRASNKFWTFINKHFTIPFKFGLLSNPGFLLGNIGDAYFKLATTMSQKYGTSFAAEAKGVAESINTVIHLKNTYSEVFQEWLKVVDENSLNIADEARIPEIVAMTPKYKDMFLQWLNGDLKVKARNPATKKLEEVPIFNDLAKSQIDEARVYMMLQGMQMNSNKLREYADLAGLAPTSDFDVPSNMWDRITQGKGSYRWNKPSTWGIFMNNPIMKAFTDASGGWEELIRTASIVDDLKHKAYSIEDLSEYSKYLSPDLGESRRLFDVHLEEAKNTMFNAQFDYERVNNFFDGIGKVVPFPIFFLKNFQYWMDVFMRNPQFVDNVIDVQEGLWAGHNEKDDKFMKEAKGRGAIPVQGDALPNWFKGVYKPSPLQSMFGAFNLLNSPLDNLTYRVNPLVSGTASVIGQATGDPLTTLSDSESIKYRPYSTDMYERNVKLGDEEFNPINYTVHRMNPFDRSMNAWLRAPDKMKEGEFQLSDALPSVFQPIF